MGTERITAADIHQDAGGYDVGTYNYRLRIQAASDAEAIERIDSAHPALVQKVRLLAGFQDSVHVEVILRALAAVLKDEADRKRRSTNTQR